MGATLRRARERRLMTQAELSAKTGISAANLSRIETGKQQPRFSTLRRLAAALDIDPTELLADDADESVRTETEGPPR